MLCFVIAIWRFLCDLFVIHLPLFSKVYPKKYAHGFCFAVLCCGYILTDFPISIRLTSLALWQSNDCLSASKATLMNMDKYFMWIHYERLHNHNKAKHNKTVCIFLGYTVCLLFLHQENRQQQWSDIPPCIFCTSFVILLLWHFASTHLLNMDTRLWFC